MSKTKLVKTVVAIGILFCFAAVRDISAQNVATYTFTPTSGTFTPLSGATVLTYTNGDGDDGYTAQVPIGFTFKYDGTNFTQVAACTNGWMSFVAITGFARNNALDGSILPGGGSTKPFVAPFFDDIDMTSGSVSYLTTGTAPNRVFTMQWLNAKWDYLAAAPGLSFQAKLYETTNTVQFIYRQEAGAIGIDPNSFGASIGLSGTGTGSGSYLSLNNSSASPTASSTTDTRNISTKPATGQTYTFSSLVTASSASVSGRVLTNDGGGVFNALVTLTDLQGETRTMPTSVFGYFRFDEVASGQTYVVSVKSKRFQFASQVVSVNEDLNELSFVAQ